MTLIMPIGHDGANVAVADSATNECLYRSSEAGDEVQFSNYNQPLVPGFRDHDVPASTSNGNMGTNPRRLSSIDISVSFSEENGCISESCASAIPSTNHEDLSKVKSLDASSVTESCIMGANDSSCDFLVKQNGQDSVMDIPKLISTDGYAKSFQQSPSKPRITEQNISNFGSKSESLISDAHVIKLHCSEKADVVRLHMDKPAVIQDSTYISSNLNTPSSKKRLRNYYQRRTVSESNYSPTDLENIKNTSKQTRHSFSSYDTCDSLINLENVASFLVESYVSALSSKGEIMPDVILTCADNSDSFCNLECVPNSKVASNNHNKTSPKIPETLINKAKKSMIEEYKNLKKKNSSSSSNNNIHDSVGRKFCDTVETQSLNQLLQSGYSGTAKEPFENSDPDWITPPPDHLSDIARNITLVLGNEGPMNEIILSDDFNIINVPKPVMSETVIDKVPLGNVVVVDNQGLISKSSPPSRLESWKNILAEKKNFIRSPSTDRGIYIRDNEIESEESTSDSCSAFDYRKTNMQSIDDTLKQKQLTAESDISDERSVRSLEGLSVDPLEVEVIYTSKEALLVQSCPYSQSSSSSKCITVNNNCCNVVKGHCSDVSCINSLNAAIDTEKDTYNQKHRLKEACQGIATALCTLPEVDESHEDLESVDNNGDNSLDEPRGQPVIILTLEDEDDKIASTQQKCINSVRCQNDCRSCTMSDKTKQNTEIILHDQMEKGSNASLSTDDDSDYCQTDECGDDCDYCSAEDAEDEDEDICEICLKNRNRSPTCIHTRVITNGSLRQFRRRRTSDLDNGRQKGSGSHSLVFQAAMRRRRINQHGLSAIREYSNSSDEIHDSDEELSHDDSMCDLSSSWKFGLSRESDSSRDSTLRSKDSDLCLPPDEVKQFTKIKSNSLPSPNQKIACCEQDHRRPGSAIFKSASTPEDENGEFAFESGIKLPPRPPKAPKYRPILSALSISPPNILRPAMGLQSLQQRIPSSRHSNLHLISTGPKTVTPRSPSNPNPPFGYPSPPSPPIVCPGSPSLHTRRSPPVSERAPASPRTNSRSGALISRNFSISDDEGGQRASRRQVTIIRHEAAYKEAVDKGCVLPSPSPVDPYWLSWKLGVLLKTIQEVGSHLEEAEKSLAALGVAPQDSNLAEQYAQNVRKFRDRLPDLQRGIDDVNDQTARFSAHNVSLSPVNSAAINDLNNRWKNLETTVNDRWRTVAGRSREVTPLTPAQLAASVSPPWERAAATNKVPYYINHARETTNWDHPDMMDLLESLSEFNHIKFSAYRTASKLRMLQKKLGLDRAKLQLVTDVFDEHGLRGQNDRLIDVNDMVIVLSTLYGRIAADYPEINTAVTTDLCLNWLLNVYDSQRTGQMRVLSFRVGLICLCRGHLEEKYRYMFRLIADPNRLADQRKLGLLLHDCVQVPRQLGEVAAFGGSNIEPSVRSCFTKAGKDREAIEAVHFLTWVQQEPQSLVWLAVLHRVAASENVLHQVKCNICKTCPIVGLRYRCLKCLSFDMCQRCFFDGRSGKSHKITHPMHEYCTATTAGDEVKDFTKALKNKFKSKRSLQKHTKKGYLPVQTVLEGDALESPSPSPSHVSSHDMHSRLELYASRLAEVELRTNSNSTPDSEDEHGLIAQYCQSLSSSDAPFPVPKSPLQIMASVDADQKDELEQMIRDLEEENRCLQDEYERLKSQQPSGTILDDAILQRSESEMLAEAKLLREHKGRLEARMGILEDHNRQLEAQLQRLRQLLDEQQSGIRSPNKSGTLQTKSVTASQLAMDSPAKINGHATQGDLEKAVGHLVDSMNRGMANGSRDAPAEEELEEYDNTTTPTAVLQLRSEH